MKRPTLRRAKRVEGVTNKAITPLHLKHVPMPLVLSHFHKHQTFIGTNCPHFSQQPLQLVWSSGARFRVQRSDFGLK